MKNRLILIWYLLYALILLIFNADPRNIPISVLFSTIIVPLSIVNIFLALIQLLKLRLQWRGYVAIAMLLLSLYQLSGLFTLNGKEDDGEIRVLSFNTSFFRIPGLYSPEYFNPQKPTANDKMVDWIIQQDADFLFLQEFFNDEKSPDFNNVKAIMERGGYVDYFYINAPRHDNGTSRGVILFSKKPLFGKQKLFLGENRFNGALRVLTTWNEDTLQLVNVHLKSSAFELRKNIKSPRGMWHEVGKFFNDGKLKAVQTQKVLEQLDGENYPTIICGDFNSTRYSYVYARMKEDYQNLFNSCGSGWGFTFYGWWDLPLKLDYQFCNDRVIPRTLSVADTMRYSDHLPLIGTYDLAD